MKKLLFPLLAAILCVAQAKASGPENVFLETFANVTGERDGSTAIDISKFDNPDGWTFKDAYAGPECIIIKKGGSVTLPAIPTLNGNASFHFEIIGYDTETGEPNYEYNNHTLSLNIGELSTTWVDGSTAGMDDAYCIFNVTPESRMTVTAKDDIKLSYARIYYGAYGGWGVVENDKIFQYSIEGGDEYHLKEFYRPIDVTVKSNINFASIIMVYTVDGSTPTRTSPRYDGKSPIHIDKTTTLTFGLIGPTGYFFVDKPKIYTFPVATEPEIPASTVKINVVTGTLEDQLMDIDLNFIEGLELHGKINGKDLKALCNTNGMMSRLRYLNMKDVTFEYDDYCYKTATYAPEGGMGQSGVIYTYFSAENREDYGSTGPMTGRYDIYSNNLSSAFTNHPTLSRIELPEFLTSIGSAFANCQNLAMVTLPPNITEVGAAAFSDCPNLWIKNLPESLEIINDLAFSGTKLTGDINLPKLKYIGDGAFSGTKILSFVFNPGIEYIGSGAFSGTLLTEINMPYPPETLHSYTFECDCLEEAKFGEGLKRLEEYVFGKYYQGNPKIELPQSIIELAADALPEKYTKSIVPEEGIRYVGAVAYAVAEDREEYTIKAGTKSIAERLFEGNQAKKITVPASVTNVGARAFAGSGIESLPVMEGVTEWRDGLFNGCSNLARITIPEYITNIGWSVFEYCSSLWQIKYNAVDADIHPLFNQHQGRPCSFKGIIIGEGVKRIPTGIFDSNHGPINIVLPQSVERIDTAAFYFCNNLRSIYLPDGIKVIEPNTFASCGNLEDVHMPINLDRISNNAFSQCNALKTISIPEGTKILEDGAFSYCQNASTIYLPSTLIYIGNYPFYNVGLYNQVKITSASVDPLIADGTLWDSSNANVVQLKVPNASVEDYKQHPVWSRFADVIVPIDEIAAKEETVSTTFETAIDESTDLSDTVVGDIYVTVNEDSGDGYDATDGSIVLSSTMTDEDAEAIGGLAPGKTDLANRFNGLVVMVPTGQGTVTVNCLTIGTKHVGVKIGEGEPASFKKDSKGDISVDYNVVEDTYVYVYAIETAPAENDPAESPRRIKSRAADDCIKIYAITVTPTSFSGIDDLETESNLSPIADWYTIDGVKVDKPSAKGIYIVKRENGTISKLILK